jgi:hypothetical protein
VKVFQIDNINSTGLFWAYLDIRLMDKLKPFQTNPIGFGINNSHDPIGMLSAKVHKKNQKHGYMRPISYPNNFI